MLAVRQDLQSPTGTRGFPLLKMDGNDNKNRVKNKNTTTRFSLETTLVLNKIFYENFRPPRPPAQQQECLKTLL